ncbi:MAG: curli assembly protein CsgF [Bacteroidota bacterium]|nr:curli assembly protein CsgF [Bacteroidota bacterium]
MKIIFKTLFMLFFFATGKTYGQQFVYTPKNPAFGGNPYNYSWLMSSAQAQNDIKTTAATNPYSSTTTNPLTNFTASLNQQILSELSRQIVAKQFGENALAAGTYILGNYQINISNQSSGLNITILDNSSGSSTTVSVPYF